MCDKLVLFQNKFYSGKNKEKGGKKDLFNVYICVIFCLIVKVTYSITIKINEGLCQRGLIME